jgi:hypothetical protein
MPDTHTYGRFLDIDHHIISLSGHTTTMNTRTTKQTKTIYAGNVPDSINHCLLTYSLYRTLSPDLGFLRYRPRPYLHACFHFYFLVIGLSLSVMGKGVS